MNRPGPALLAPLLLLLLVAPAGSAQRRGALPAGRQVPDWRIVDPSGDADEISPPLTFNRIAGVIRDSIGGPLLRGLRVTSGARQYAGDRTLLATISPNGDGIRDKATVRFRLDQAATVTMDVFGCSKSSTPVWSTTTDLKAGNNSIVWAPSAKTMPRTYLLRLTVSANEARHVYGNTDYRLAELSPAPVVRVQGVAAGFGQRSYSPGASARLRIATDAEKFTVQFFRAGPETQPTLGYEMEGVPVSEPRLFDWSAHRQAPGTIVLRLGDWPNGIYYAEVKASDGRVGYAPFVMRPPVYGAHRVAYIVRTNTWEAYNHQDLDGDGWGDTWYANNYERHVDLARPYFRLGAPPSWRRYDVSPLHWIYQTGKNVDFLSDDDLETFQSARELSGLYDLIVFPGYDEYVTDHVYDLIAGYRNLGGNLMFLSATNFLWKIERHGNRITRIAEWRTLGRPESRLIGVQYRGNDEGEHRGPYDLTPFGRRSWVFAGVDLNLLPPWRWFGIEFDQATSASPKGIHVLASVNPHMRDRGLRGQMTYYERGRAKVFAAGTLNFPESAYYPAYNQVLENLWARLVEP